MFIISTLIPSGVVILFQSAAVAKVLVVSRLELSQVKIEILHRSITQNDVSEPLTIIAPY